MKVRFVAALVAVLAVAGCGGSNHHASPASKVTVSSDLAVNVVQRGCPKSDFTMQCAYPRPIYDSSSQGFSANGIDFAWSCPPPAGWAFGASYLSPDGSKNWTPGCVNWWRASGKSIVFVWESSATRAADGYGAGQADARWAVQQAAALGNTDRPIFFAIDSDFNGGDVDSYFRGVRSVLPYERTGAYGGIRPLEYLHDAGLIKYGWQAFAWSYGQWGFSVLRQVQNGDAVDWDLALAADYGQWPYHTGPTDAQYNSWRRARDSSLRGYRHQHCTQPVLTREACATLAARVNAFQVLVDGQGQGPACFGSTRKVHASVCQIVRPAVAVWSRASVSSNRWHNYRVARYFDRRIAYTLAHSRL